MTLSISKYHNIGPVMRQLEMEPQEQIVTECEKLEMLEEAVVISPKKG